MIDDIKKALLTVRPSVWRPSDAPIWLAALVEYYEATEAYKTAWHDDVAFQRLNAARKKLEGE